MLKISIPERELFNEKTGSFITRKPMILTLEHSLYAISKWESEYEKPFLTETPKTEEETRYYIYCMDYSEQLTPEYVKMLSEDELTIVKDYMARGHTGTTFSGKQSTGGKKEIVTSELVYYWMIASEIPFECEHWNINRLFTLIRICGIKNNPKKMGKKDILNYNHKLNSARRAAWGSTG